MNGSVRRIRVDVPSADPRWAGSHTFFFIDATDGETGNPWWSKLFHFLLELERTAAGLNPSGVEMESAVMTGRKRQEFQELLQTAPASEVEGHRTLRSALRQLPQSDLDVPVRYFGPSPEAPPGG